MINQADIYHCSQYNAKGAFVLHEQCKMNRNLGNLLVILYACNCELHVRM